MKIHIKGGLGNQLFQFAYVHNYVILDEDCKIDLIPDSTAKLDRSFALNELADACSHFEKAHFENSKPTIPISKFLQYRERLLAYLRHSLTLNSDASELHERRLYEFAKPRLYQLDFDLPLCGYFQNWQYVENAWSLIKPELKEYLRIIQSNSAFNGAERQEAVIHFRGGDFKEQFKSFEMLGIDYYDKALRKFFDTGLDLRSILVLTDDVDFAKTMLSKLNLSEYFILGPNECSAWEALLLMSEAKFLITSNSTLSWWGAFLASKAGGTCITPKYWTPYSIRQSKRALSYPGFHSIDIRFAP